MRAIATRSSRRWGPRVLVLACAGGAAIGAAPAAGAAGQKVTATTAVARACHTAYADGAAGTQSVAVTAPVTGLVQARLSGRGRSPLTKLAIAILA